MAGHRRVREIARELEKAGGRTEEVEAVEEELASQSKPTGTSRDAAEEAHRLAGLAATGRADEEELIAAGVYSGGTDEVGDGYDDGVDSYPENHPDTGKEKEVSTVIRDGSTTHEF